MLNNVNVLFVMGAGASFEAGLPLMNDFIDKAQKIFRIYSKETFIADSLSDYNTVMDMIASLQVIHSKSFLNLYNIETLFGALEMALMLGDLAGKKKPTIEKTRDSLINLIVKTLEYSCKINVHPQSDTLKQLTLPKPYQGFSERIGNILGFSTGNCKISPAFITFNYDLLMDLAISRLGRTIDYGLESEITPGSVPLLKLHGSLNWVKHKKRRVIKSIPIKDYILPEQNTNFDAFWLQGSQIIKYDNDEYQNVPLIVPPSWNKMGYQSDLVNVWQRAADAFGKATYIFFIGYSLPETDMFFKYLYSLGTISTNNLSRVYIINPDTTVVKRFEDMLGRGILERGFVHLKNEKGLSVFDHQMVEKIYLEVRNLLF